jgi:hypothetical protein
MPVFLRVGKQRYCQGLPILAAVVTSPAASGDDEGGHLLLEHAEGGDEFQFPPVNFSGTENVRVASYEIDTNLIREGPYVMSSFRDGAFSKPLLILSRDSYAVLLTAENEEPFEEDEGMTSRSAYSFVTDLISERFVPLWDPSLLLDAPVVRAHGFPMTIAGTVESEAKVVSLPRLRYGAEAFVSDLMYSCSVPTNLINPQVDLRLTLDQRGNISLVGRVRVGVERPDRLLESLLTYSDLTALQHIYPGIFASSIDQVGYDTLQLALTVNAESEIDEGGGRSSNPLSAGGATTTVRREEEYA